MAKWDWSVEQLERDLAASFALLGRMEQGGALAAGESAALADGVLRCMNGALVKVSESLEAQALLRQELAALRQELALADSERRNFLNAQDERIRLLEAEVLSLRAQPRQGEDAVCHFPPDEFLSRPLVVRSELGDFLGVSVLAGQPLCMGDFVRLVEKGGGRRRIVCTLWEEHGADWLLAMTLSGQDAGERRCYVLETRPVLTPSGNQVAELVGMSEDGAPVSSDFLLQMFRQLRESLQE